MKLKINILLIFLSFLVISCDNDGYDEFDAGGTNVEGVSGEWYVQLLLDGEDVNGLGYYLLSTYNTAQDNGEEMWVDDHETWTTKVIVPVETQNLTFSGATLENEYSYPDGDGGFVSPIITITNGQIVENGGTTTEGDVADSIFFEVEFSDEPGTVYTIEGYRKTGFLEGEH